MKPKQISQKTPRKLPFTSKYQNRTEIVKEVLRISDPKKLEKMALSALKRKNVLVAKALVKNPHTPKGYILPLLINIYPNDKSFTNRNLSKAKGVKLSPKQDKLAVEQYRKSRVTTYEKLELTYSLAASVVNFTTNKAIRKYGANFLMYSLRSPVGPGSILLGYAIYRFSLKLCRENSKTCNKLYWDYIHKMDEYKAKAKKYAKKGYKTGKKFAKSTTRGLAEGMLKASPLYQPFNLYDKFVYSKSGKKYKSPFEPISRKVRYLGKLFGIID